MQHLERACGVCVRLDRAVREGFLGEAVLGVKRKFPVQRNMYPVPGSLEGLLGEGRRLHTGNCSAQTEGLHLLLREIVSGFRIMQRWPARPALGEALPLGAGRCRFSRSLLPGPPRWCPCPRRVTCRDALCADG